ncbi:MAG: glycosyltransferase family 2 protein [Ignavibacteriae bacterium]|nr:glycosyltransferase family 2 protein [Ignavibacteriota bacterium]
MPCLNEAETVGGCVEKAMRFLTDNQIKGEVIVADNGSNDGSPQIASDNGARVVFVQEKGYGSALMGGISAAQGKYIIMGDSDGSHDLYNLMPFLEKLREGFHLVVGNRFKGGIEPHAMSFLNKRIGNPFLSGIGRLIFKSKVKDFHCGLRGFTKKAYKKIDMRTTGMEFASEMIVKATLFDLKTTEVPTTMFPSGRTRAPHLKPFSDGWRHLRFLLLYSPKWLFLYPGFLLILLGFIIGILLIPGSLLSLDIHTMLYAAGGVIIGLQAVSFAILTKVYAMQEKLLPQHPKLNKLLKKVKVEYMLGFGAVLLILGLAGTIYAISLMGEGNFSSLGITRTMRIIIPSITLLSVGFQIIFSGFFLSILKLKIK